MKSEIDRIDEIVRSVGAEKPITLKAEIIRGFSALSVTIKMAVTIVVITYTLILVLLILSLLKLI